MDHAFKALLSLVHDHFDEMSSTDVVSQNHEVDRWLEGTVADVLEMQRPALDDAIVVVPRRGVRSPRSSPELLVVFA